MVKVIVTPQTTTFRQDQRAGNLCADARQPDSEHNPPQTEDAVLTEGQQHFSSTSTHIHCPKHPLFARPLLSACSLALSWKPHIHLLLHDKLKQKCHPKLHRFSRSWNSPSWRKGLILSLPGRVSSKEPRLIPVENCRFCISYSICEQTFLFFNPSSELFNPASDC